MNTEQVIEAIKNLPEASRLLLNYSNSFVEDSGERKWQTVEFMVTTAQLKALVSELERVKAEKEKYREALERIRPMASGMAAAYGSPAAEVIHNTIREALDTKGDNNDGI